ncbi:MAG TPA: tryptophan--tRNA ligase, partial [Thermoplasmata archaeon]|nr:tryptophan--tRNA ligase [Thermoplasmata archaeon]
TVEEQRRLGANPDICSVFALWKTRFAESDARLAEVERDCRSGALLCGECKQSILERIHPFYDTHAVAREKAKEWAESAIVTAAPKPI